MPIEIIETTLSNGVRMAIKPSSYSRQIQLVFGFTAGSRHECETTNGTAHFLEHMSFEGTDKFSRYDIGRFFQDRAIRFSAYTSPYATAYELEGHADDFLMMCENMNHVIFESTLSDCCIKTESKVILEEIQGIRNDFTEFPRELINYAAYHNTNLGRPIMGSKANVSGMTRDQLLSFRNQRYVGKNLIITATGGINPDETIRILEGYAGQITSGERASYDPVPYKGGTVLYQVPVEQMSLVLAYEASRAFEPENEAEWLVSDLLGGLSSSLLFQELRQKRGLSYSVGTSIKDGSDFGRLNIYFKTRGDQADMALEVVRAELEKLIDFISDDELKKLKVSYNKKNAMKGVSSYFSSKDIFNSIVQFGRFIPEEDRHKYLNFLSVRDLKAAVGRMLSSPLSLAAMGPTEKLQNFGGFKIAEPMAPPF